MRNPVFRHDPQVEDGQKPSLYCDLYVVDEGEIIENQRFSIGNGWMESDDGSEVTREDGGKLQLNENTAAAKLVASLAVLDNFVAELGARWEKGDQVRPTQVSFWDGLDVTVEPASREFTPKGSSEVLTQRWYNAVEFHGYEGSGNGSSAKAAPAPAASTTTAAKAPAKKAVAKKAVVKKAAASTAASATVEVAAEMPEDAGWVADDAILALIREVADSSEDEDTFIANCLAMIPEVSEVSEYLALVEDVTSEGSIWQTAVREYEAAQG